MHTHEGTINAISLFEIRAVPTHEAEPTTCVCTPLLSNCNTSTVAHTHGSWPVPGSGTTRVLTSYVPFYFYCIQSIQSSFRMSYGFNVWIFLCPHTLNCFTAFNTDVSNRCILSSTVCKSFYDRRPNPFVGIYCCSKKYTHIDHIW